MRRRKIPFFPPVPGGHRFRASLIQSSRVAARRQEARRPFWCCWLLLLSLLLWPGLAHSRVYVVDPNNAQASDHNAGTEANPYLTLDKALKEMGPWDSVLLKAGGNVTILQRYLAAPSESQVSPAVPPSTSYQSQATPPQAPEKPAAGLPLPGGSPQAPSSNWWQPYLLPALIAALFTGLILLFFLVIQPRRKRGPLLKALEIIEADRFSELGQAEELLNLSLTAGLRSRDIAEARFALAYVRARLKRYPEAAAVLSDLLKSGQPDRETAYLALWLEYRQKNYDRLENLYDEHAELLGDFLDSRLMAGIAFLRQAQIFWFRRQVSTALEYYERLRGLEVPELKDQIPSSIDDYQVMFGIVSLFEKEIDQARQHFAGAVQTAQKEGKSPVQGELGLLLCQWLKSPSPTFDEELGQVLAALETLEQEKTAKAGEDDIPAEKDGSGDEKLLRNVLLWHAVSLLSTWLGLPVHQGLPASERSEFERRLQKVISVDPDMGDPYLLSGLIAYYFAASPEEREQALKSLQEAISKEVHLPEVLNLVEREQRIKEAEENILQRFLVLVRHYLSDQGVPEHLRQKLRERLDAFSFFRGLEEMDLVKGPLDVAPSLEDIKTRGALLHRRIYNIVKPQLAKTEPETAAGLEERLSILEDITSELAKNKESLESAEFDLMQTTGEFLFKDDEAVGPEAEGLEAEGLEAGGD